MAVAVLVTMVAVAVAQLDHLEIMVLAAVDQDILKMMIIIYLHNFLMLLVLGVHWVVPMVQHQEQHLA
jgi:hypothetical protein